MTEPTQERTTLELAEQEAARPRPVIMVVEDDPLIRAILDTLFTEEGYTVMLAADGAAAMTALTTLRPDLVTLDLNLPGVAGGDVLRMIRRTPTLSAVKVVIISGEGTIPKSIRELAEAVIRKPFEVANLIAIVRRHLPSEPADSG